MSIQNIDAVSRLGGLLNYELNSSIMLSYSCSKRKRNTSNFWVSTVLIHNNQQQIPTNVDRLIWSFLMQADKILCFSGILHWIKIQILFNQTTQYLVSLHFVLISQGQSLHHDYGYIQTMSVTEKTRHSIHTVQCEIPNTDFDNQHL